MANLCWGFSAGGTFLVFPTYRVRRDPFKFPLPQIIAYHAFAKTLRFDKDNPQSGFETHMTVRVTFTPRR